MQTSPGTAEDLDRLRHEREDADRAYNEALSALDDAVQRLRELPARPARYDDSQLARLNERWDILSLKPADRGGWFQRVRSRVWGLVAPLFEGQQAFNAAVVDHLNRNVATHRETAEALDATLTAIREELARLVQFEIKLILYAQQITAYVDTKDRYVAALPNSLAIGLSGLADELHKRWESMSARERRHDAQVNEVRNTLGIVHHAILTLKRALEQRPIAGAAPAESTTAAAPAIALDAYKYVGFEDEFRGSRQEIRERMATYVPDFEGLADVLDIGCGRGEFLDLLRERGIRARGVDLNDEMAAICRERGLDATAGDALGYLTAQPDASLGGLFGAQVVEHLEPDYLIRMLEVAYHKLRPGSKVVLETVNPACWYAFFSSYIRDITHVTPLHPDTLRYLLVASGFQRVTIRYAAPFPEESKLQPIRSAAVAGADAPPAGDPLAEMAVTFNGNVTKLNSLLFTYLDYAVIAERP